MSIYKRGGVYWYKFQWKGALVRESTKQGNDKGLAPRAPSDAENGL
jgi:hypothetical protein